MMGLLGQSVLVSCIPECHSMPRFVIQRQSYGLGFGAFADAGKLDTLGGASSVAPHESPFRQTDDRRWKLDNL